MDRQQIFEKIKAHESKIKEFGINNIGLFGSYVRNEQNAQSDIDLLIDFEPGKENFDNLMNIYDFLESIFTEHKVEIITKNGLSKFIGPYILNEVEYVEIGS